MASTKSEWDGMCAQASESWGMAASCFSEDHYSISVSFFLGSFSSIWASGGREAGNLVAAFVTDRYPFYREMASFVSHLYLDL